MALKICIITPGTIASTPRVVKEAEALSDAGYHVHIVYTRHVKYLVERDQAILENHPEWTANYLDWSSSTLSSKAVKYISGAKNKIADIIRKSNLYPTRLSPFLLNRFYFWQLRKAIACKADLYIAHYPDCLAIASRAAQVNKTIFAYDAEDYHRGERLPASLLKIIAKIEDHLLPYAQYISASSPLIGEEYRKLHPNVPVISVENMFPLKNQPIFQRISNVTFKFFWFSQTIGSGRGLEEFISILERTQKKNILLTLLGNVSKLYYKKLIDLWAQAELPPKNLVFIDTVSEKEIFRIAAGHHFGLCLEIPVVANKDFCISNKLYTYILSGNFLILSKTRAQSYFHKSFPNSGITIELENLKEAAERVRDIMIDTQSLTDKRNLNYRLGSNTLNFDIHKNRLLDQVTNVCYR